MLTLYFRSLHGIQFPIIETPTLGPRGRGLRFDTEGHPFAILCGVGQSSRMLAALEKRLLGYPPDSTWDAMKYEIDGEMSIEAPPPARWPCPVGSKASRYAGKVKPETVKAARNRGSKPRPVTNSTAWRATLPKYEPYSFR